MPLPSTTVTAVTMEESCCLFTSSSTGNGETRQKRKMHIEWADLKHKALRESANTHISKREKILPQIKLWKLNKDIVK
jgi:hypothetical protein